MRSFIVIILSLIALLPSEKAFSRNGDSCGSFFEMSSLDPELVEIAKNWDSTSMEKLIQKMEELDEAKLKRVPWVNKFEGQKTNDTISFAARNKIAKILRATEFAGDNVVNARGLFGVRQHNFTGTKSYKLALPNSSLAPTLLHIYLRMYSHSAIRIYMEDFLTHTFQMMQKSDSLRIREKAQDGILDHEFAVEVLKSRVRARGLNIKEITSTDELTNFFFRMAVKKGVPVDTGFQSAKKQNYATIYHGVFTHLIQFDMISDVIASHSRTFNTSPQVFFDYLSTKEGNAFWYAAFDGSGGTASNTGFTNPFAVATAALFMKLRTPLEEKNLEAERSHQIDQLKTLEQENLPSFD